MESGIETYQRIWHRLEGIPVGSTVHFVEKVASGVTTDTCGVFMGHHSDPEYKNFALLGPNRYEYFVWTSTSIVVEPIGAQ